MGLAHKMVFPPLERAAESRSGSPCEHRARQGSSRAAPAWLRTAQTVAHPSPIHDLLACGSPRRVNASNRPVSDRSRVGDVFYRRTVQYSRQEHLPNILRKNPRFFPLFSVFSVCADCRATDSPRFFVSSISETLDFRSFPFEMSRQFLVNKWSFNLGFVHYSPILRRAARTG